MDYLKSKTLSALEVSKAMEVDPRAVPAWEGEGMPTNGNETYDLSIVMYWLTGHRFNKTATLDGVVEFTPAQKVALGWLEGPCTGGATRRDDLSAYLDMCLRGGIQPSEAVPAVHLAMANYVRTSAQFSKPE